MVAREARVGAGGGGRRAARRDLAGWGWDAVQRLADDTQILAGAALSGTRPISSAPPTSSQTATGRPIAQTGAVITTGCRPAPSMPGGHQTPPRHPLRPSPFARPATCDLLLGPGGCGSERNGCGLLISYCCARHTARDSHAIFNASTGHDRQFHAHHRNQCSAGHPGPILDPP